MVQLGTLNFKSLLISENFVFSFLCWGPIFKNLLQFKKFALKSQYENICLWVALSVGRNKNIYPYNNFCTYSSIQQRNFFWGGEMETEQSQVGDGKSVKRHCLQK